MTPKEAISQLNQMAAEYLAEHDPAELTRRLKEKFSKMISSNIPEELKKTVKNLEEELNKASGVNLTYMSEKKHGKDMKKIDPKTHLRGNLIDKMESADVGAGSMGSEGMNLTPGRATSGLGKSKKKLDKRSPDDCGPIPMDASEKDPGLASRLKKCLMRKTLAAAENPDEKSDAQLGEKVENLVSDHFKDNKEAERKEGHKLAYKAETGHEVGVHKQNPLSPKGHSKASGDSRALTHGIHRQVLKDIKKMPKPNLPKSETGVHPSVAPKEKYKHRGISPVGMLTRYSAGKDKKSAKAMKEHHKDVLGEMKTMPKPNLPKSESLVNKLKKCMITKAEIGKQKSDNPVDMTAETKRAIREPADKPFKIQPRRDGQANKPTMEKAEDLNKKHYGFKAVEESARESGARDPAAVAAAAGRKKFGKKKMAEKAAAGKKHHTKKSEILNKPYHSEAQRKWAHTKNGEKALGGKAAVHEWDEASKGKKLPEKVKKAQSKHDRCVEHVKENSPEVKNPHAVCVKEGVKPAKWKS